MITFLVHRHSFVAVENNRNHLWNNICIVLTMYPYSIIGFICPHRHHLHSLLSSLSNNWFLSLSLSVCLSVCLSVSPLSLCAFFLCLSFFPSSLSSSVVCIHVLKEDVQLETFSKNSVNDHIPPHGLQGTIRLGHPDGQATSHTPGPPPPPPRLQHGPTTARWIEPRMSSPPCVLQQQ